MHSKNNNTEIMVGNNTNEIINKLLHPRLHKYQ